MVSYPQQWVVWDVICCGGRRSAMLYVWRNGLVAVGLSLCLWGLTSCGSGGTGSADGGTTESVVEAPSLPTVEGCGSTTLLVNPEDPSKTGPWPVGARTVTLGKYTVEVLYPATPGSEEGKSQLRYDVRKQLPPKEVDKIPDAKNPWQDCNCYQDLPPDAARGPYPVVWFIHGTAGFRTQSLHHMQHWASRGFVVISADHPGINLGDVLALNLVFGEQGNDLRAMLKVFRTQPASFEFLKGSMDMSRMGVAGHSAGGSALADLGDEEGVLVLIPMAAGGTSAEKPARSTLVLGGEEDGVVPYKRQQDGYASSPKPKRLVGLKKAGHLAFSDLCALGREQGGLLKIAADNGVEIPPAFSTMIGTLATDGCKEGQLSSEKGWEIIHFASSAVLEETLHCSKTAPKQLKNLPSLYPEVAEFKEDLQ